MKNLFTLISLLLLWAGNSFGQSLLLNPAGDGGFETGNTLALNNWVQKTNGTTSSFDGWVVGSAPVVSAGANGGYVSSYGGTAWVYAEMGTPGYPSIIHLYHDFTLPAGESVAVISFKWKAQGEGSGANDADNLKVFLTPSSITPNASTAVSSLYQIGDASYNQSSASWNSVNNITVTGTPGSAYRLIFSWYSNASGIFNPPAAIDEVSVTSYAPIAANAAPVSFTSTAVTGTGMTIGWTDNSTNETGFRVYRSTDNVNFTQVGSDIPSATTTGTGTAYTQVQTGLTPGVTYYYRIAAYFGLESAYLTGSQSTPASTLLGVKTVGGTGSPDYPTIAAAIADLNLKGAGPGGVTFNIAAGHTETFASATAGYILTTSGSASRPITFQKNGSGANPLVTAPAGTGTADAVIAIAGCDYVTFDGIDLAENAANLNSTTRMEWGYAIVKSVSTGVDGSQNISIKNCSITLDKTNQTSIGIYSGNFTLADPTLQLTVTAPSGTNSNLKVNNNTISCYTGISLNGYTDPGGETFLDQNNEIGKDGANTITNIGGNSIASIACGIIGQNQNNLKVANNNITSTMGGAAYLVSGIYVINGKNASYDIYNNQVSIQYSGSGSASFYPIYGDMSSSGNSNTVNVYNNTITGCTFTTLTNGQVRFINLNNLGVNANVYGNTISNNTIGDAVMPSTGAIHYLVCTKNSSIYGPLNIYNNTVSGNQRNTASPSTQPGTFIWANGSGSLLNLYGNSITNNVVRATSTTTIISSSFLQGSIKIYDNLVSNITEANGVCYGISLSNSSSNIIAEIYRNTIRNIEGTTAATKIHGIYYSGSGSGTYSYIYNNMVSDLRAPAALAAANGGDCLTGINISGSNYLGVFNNSIYINGSSTAAIFGTSAFYATSSNQNLELRNNIFVNTSTPNGTGITAAVRFTNASWATGLSLSSNNNLLYAGIPGAANLLFTDVTNKDQTLLAYQTRMFPRESQSVTEMPPFVNTSSGNTDLHLQPSVATQCESGGSIISGTYPVNTDIDNNPRYPNSGYPVGSVTPYAPDMGADEFGGIAVNLTAPVITYNPLPPAAITGDRTLAVTITDSKGVPVSGSGLPKLYWKINAGAYTAAPDPVVSGSTYTFTFGNGAVAADVVSYYVVAQDVEAIPNVTSNPFGGAGGYTSNPPACSTPPTTPASYTIVAPFEGTYHVGVGKDYATLTLAAAAVNSNVLTGPVTLILDDATYPAETFPVVFNANAGSSEINTLTIKPLSGVSPVFNSTTVTTGLLNLNGIDYMIIDGSNNGTNSKDLTFSNSKTGTNGTYAISFRGTATDPTTNITIKNCILKSVRVETSSTSNNTSAIRFISAGAGFENCVIDHNIISSSYNGIQLWGFSGGSVARNIQITNNTIGATVSADAVSGRGIDIQNADNTLIENNEIMGPSDGSINKGQVGIQLGAGTTNTTIRKNNIHTFIHPADDGGACYGIYSNTNATTVTEISNNLIYDLQNGGSGPGVVSTNTYGIFFNSGGNTRILFNTIDLNGPYLSSSKNASSACIGFMNSVLGGGFEIRNNIFRNGMTLTGAPSLNGKAYGIMMYTSPSQFSVIDNNDYFVDGYNGAIAQFYAGNVASIVDYPTLASWQAYTGQEAGSLNTDPAFTSAMDLLPTSAAMNNKGAYMAEFPTDFTNATRHNPTDFGAYDYAVNISDYHTLPATSITKVAAQLNGNLNTNNEIVETYFEWGLTTAYGNTADAAGLGTPPEVQSTTLVAVNTPISGLTANTTYHYRLLGIPTTSGQANITGEDMSFTTLPLAPVVTTTAATAIAPFGATLNGTVNPNGVNATVTFEYGLTTAYGTTVSATPGTVTGSIASDVMAVVPGLLPLTTYHYRVVAANFNESANGNDMTFTTLPTPASVTTLAASNIIAHTATLNGSVNANNQTNTVTFEWGLTTAYGNIATASPSSVSGNSVTQVSAAVSGLNYATVYHFRCVANGPGGVINGSDMQFVSDCPLPALPVAITGPQEVCRNTSGISYTVSPVSEATSYLWTVPAGATIAAGDGTNSITVSYSPTAVSGNVTVAAISGCGTGPASTLAVTVNALPVPVISGPASVCFNSTDNVYTTETGMTNYAWTVTGGIITSGTGSNSINVTWNTQGAQSVSVNYTNSNGCQAMAPVSFAVTVNTLPVAPVITGPNVACESSAYLDYSCQAGMTSYTWDMTPNAGTMTQTGTNVVTIFWTLPGNNWVSVNYTDANGCSAPAPTIYNVSVNPLPGTPGTITGQSSVCAGATSIAYSVSQVSNASTYSWTLPGGATIASGAGTNSITVNYDATAVSGNISVLAQNSCGNGQPSPALAVSVNTMPAAAGTITGDATVCQGSIGIEYSVGAINNATAYIWTLPAGATIVSGSGTNDIVVDYSLAAVSGTISVSGQNSCGTGIPSVMPVTVNIKPATPVITRNESILSSNATSGNQWYMDGNIINGATSQTYTILQDGTYTDIVTLNGCSSDVSNSIVIIHTGIGNPDKEMFSISPNPGNGAFWLTIKSPTATVYDLKVLNSLGDVVYHESHLEVNGEFKQYYDLQWLSSGMYTVVLRSDKQQVTRKIVVNK
jgi:hypothetical protein